MPRKDHGEPVSNQGELDLRRVPINHANPSASPGSNEARTMTVTSGRKWSAALTLSGPLGSLARMCLESSIWHSTKCALTWKVSATKSGRCVYRLVPSIPRTSDNGSGLWPTASANNFEMQDVGKYLERREKCKATKKNGNGFGLTLGMAVKMWPTQSATDWKGAGRNGVPRDRLDYAVERGKTKTKEFGPTPSANNQSGGITGLNGGSGARAKLHAMVGREEGLKMSGGKLNPTWVEWLMGFPLGWTALDASAMPLSRKSSKSSAK